MDKKEFKRLMQCGNGRIALVLQKNENIEKYKDIVLWGYKPSPTLFGQPNNKIPL